MTPGDRVTLQDGRQALVMTVGDGVATVAPIDPHWPFPRPAIVVTTESVTPMPPVRGRSPDVHVVYPGEVLL